MVWPRCEWVWGAASELVVVGLVLSPAGWLPQWVLCGDWDLGLASRFSGLFGFGAEGKAFGVRRNGSVHLLRRIALGSDASSHL
jgi:hypothetical protein